MRATAASGSRASSYPSRSRRCAASTRARVREGPQVGGPACAYQSGRLTTHAEPGEERRGVLRGGAQEQHVAGVAVGGALFEQRRVAVIPADDQAQVRDRGVGGCAGSDDDGHAAQTGLEESVVARVRARVGAQARVGVCGEHPCEGALQQVEALGGGDHGDGTRPEVAAVANAAASTSAQVCSRWPGSMVMTARLATPAATSSMNSGPFS